MKLLHELGFILNFENNYEYIIIQPQWLSNVFKSVISLKNTNQIKDGIIQINQIIQNLKNLLKLNNEQKQEENKKNLDTLSTLKSISTNNNKGINNNSNTSNLSNKSFFEEEDYKSQIEFLIE